MPEDVQMADHKKIHIKSKDKLTDNVA